MLIWVCILLCWSFCLCVIWFEPSFILLCTVPSLPDRVCPVGSSQPAGWGASRGGSPGPRGVLSPPTVSRVLPDSPPATCNRCNDYGLAVVFSKQQNHLHFCQHVAEYLLNLLNQIHSRQVFAFQLFVINRLVQMLTCLVPGLWKLRWRESAFDWKIQWTKHRRGNNIHIGQTVLLKLLSFLSSNENNTVSSHRTLHFTHMNTAVCVSSAFVLQAIKILIPTGI